MSDTISKPTAGAVKSVVLMTTAISLVYGMNGGIRGNSGLLLAPLAENSGLSYADVSFIVAVSQLIFGLLQPFFGAVALQKGSRFVMIAGSLLMACGLLFLPFATGYVPLLLSFGIVFAAGTSALSFGLLLGIVSGQVSSAQSSIVSGWLNASSGLGMTVLAPLLQIILTLGGLTGIALFLGLPTLLFIPLALWLCKKAPQGGIDAVMTQSPPVQKQSARSMIYAALKTRDYLFLLIGFATCGFHMAILETHLFNQFVDVGFSRDTAALLFTIYGVCTVAGSLASGYLCIRFPMPRILGSIYALRIVQGFLLLLLPPTFFALVPFMILLGLTSDSTVSPTSGLLLSRFGAERLATLFGLAFLAHQVGAFISAWAGGLILEMFGSYTALWMADAVLALLAAVVSYRVRYRDREPA